VIHPPSCRKCEPTFLWLQLACGIVRSPHFQDDGYGKGQEPDNSESFCFDSKNTQNSVILNAPDGAMQHKPHRTALLNDKVQPIKNWQLWMNRRFRGVSKLYNLPMLQIALGLSSKDVEIKEGHVRLC
jgi:hypothetical protein